MLRLIDGNNVFRRRYETIGHTALTSLYSNASFLPLGETCIWVWDAKDAKQRRKEVYPNYKGNRPPAADDFYQTMNLFKQLLTHSRSLQLTVPTYEADDVIATLAKHSDSKVVIDSNDMDFAGLTSSRITTEMESKLPCAAEDIQLYKTLVGDKSDNIPGLPKFGPKAFEDLTTSNMRMLKSFLCGATDTVNFDQLNWTDNRINYFKQSQNELRIYWQIVELLDVPMQDIQQNLLVPTYDVAGANKIFSDLFLPTIG